MVVEGVDVDPLHGSEWRQQLAVVETSSLRDVVVHWSSHHWSLHHRLGLGSVVGVLHVGPDPEGASVVGSFILSDNELLTLRVVSLDGIGACVLKSPIKSSLVDISAPVTDLIRLVEISCRVSSSSLDGLP